AGLHELAQLGDLVVGDALVDDHHIAVLQVVDHGPHVLVAVVDARRQGAGQVVARGRRVGVPVVGLLAGADVVAAGLGEGLHALRARRLAAGLQGGRAHRLVVRLGRAAAALEHDHADQGDQCEHGHPGPEQGALAAPLLPSLLLSGWRRALAAVPAPEPRPGWLLPVGPGLVLGLRVSAIDSLRCRGRRRYRAILAGYRSVADER